MRLIGSKTGKMCQALGWKGWLSETMQASCLAARQGKGHFCIASELVCVHVAGPRSKWMWPAQVPMEARKQCRSLRTARLSQIQSVKASCLPIVLLAMRCCQMCYPRPSRSH